MGLEEKYLVTGDWSQSKVFPTDHPEDLQNVKIK